MVSWWRLLLLLPLLVGGCSGKSKAAAEKPAPSALASVAGAPAVAAPVPVPVPTEGDTGSSLVDLLAVTPSRIAVSSAVRNPRDFPEHLIDGDPNTAWNSKTGDLVGATIAFRVPGDARVEAIEMTAGYVRVKDANDLFTMNHRIRRVEILRNGTSLKAVTLDVASRTMQRVAIGASGGDFQIVVKETAPGSKADWREVVVSELRVLGVPGKERRAPSDRLLVYVGGLDAAPPETTGTVLEIPRLPKELLGAHASLAAFCQAFERTIAPIAVAEIAEYAQWNDAAPVRTIACEEKALPPIGAVSAPWTGAKAVRLAWAYTDAVFVIGVTAEGMRLTPIRFEDRYGNGMGCGPVWTRDHVDRVRFENGWLVTTIDGRGPVIYGRSNDVSTASAYQRGAAICRMRAGELTCLEWNPQYLESFAYKVYTLSKGSDVAAIPWEREATFRVDETGAIARVPLR